MNQKHALIAGTLAALAASLCCVAPLLLLSAGIGGAWVANLTAVAPARPIFVVVALVFVGLAFRKLYFGSTVCIAGQECAEGVSLRRQRLLFWAVAIPLLGLLTFPWVAPLFY